MPRHRRSASASTVDSASRTTRARSSTGFHEAKQKKAAGVVINPAGYTTTSVAILDAIYRGASCRPSRCTSPTSTRARNSAITPMSRRAPRRVICGFGIEGYALAIAGLASLIGVKARSLKSAESHVQRKPGDGVERTGPDPRAGQAARRNRPHRDRGRARGPARARRAPGGDACGRVGRRACAADPGESPRRRPRSRRRWSIPPSIRASSPRRWSAPPIRAPSRARSRSSTSAAW